MSRILEIIGNVAMYGILVGVVAWLFWRALDRSTERPLLIFKWLVTVLLIVCYVWLLIPMVRRGGFAAVAGIFLAVAWGNLMVIFWGHSLISAIASPLTSIFDGGNEPPEPKPYYSVAQARRKRREFLQAVMAIREQLAKFPNDFEGVMLLASIQAEDLQDLPSAEITLNHFCDQPEASARQFAAAMNLLADWNIKLIKDFDSARAALEKIVARFPESEVALQASQRIAHLQGTEKHVLASLDRQPMAVREGIQNIGLLASSEHLRPDEPDPAKLAAAYVEHLQRHPLDTEAREKLAVIYAEHYQRLDLVESELNQLIEIPNQPAKRVAHWLNLLADLQVRLGADYETVRGTLERIIERFPDLAAGEMARTRLGKLKLELKGQKETPGMKLGVYEQNIGLKRGLPRQL